VTAYIVRCNPDPAAGFDLDQWFADGYQVADLDAWTVAVNLERIAAGDGLVWYVNGRGVCAFGTVTGPKPVEWLQADATYWGTPVDGPMVHFQVDDDIYAKPVPFQAMKADPIVGSEHVGRMPNSQNGTMLSDRAFTALRKLAGLP
jgi:hypothetical protein